MNDEAASKERPEDAIGQHSAGLTRFTNWIIAIYLTIALG